LFCPHCDRFVERSELEKGNEYEKDQYVLFCPDELKKIEPGSARSMDILEFVKLGEIDPFYFDASCYVALGEAGAHAFPLLLNAMRESSFAEIEVAAEGGKNSDVFYPTPTVISIGGRDGSVRSADGLIGLQVALPKEMGGPGGKTNPEERFAAGYAACFHSSVRRVTADKKVAIGKSTAERMSGSVSMITAVVA
jgi:hypothetical protein